MPCRRSSRHMEPSALRQANYSATLLVHVPSGPEGSTASMERTDFDPAPWVKSRTSQQVTTPQPDDMGFVKSVLPSTYTAMRTAKRPLVSAGRAAGIVWNLRDQKGEKKQAQLTVTFCW